jgi:predicted RNA-binding protein
LHTVKEDEYDDECDNDMNPAAFIHNKKEYEDHLMQVIEYDTVL